MLAFIQREPGYQRVAAMFETAVISTVNWSEVAQKCLARNLDWAAVERILIGNGLRILPFSRVDAELAAALWQMTRNWGLSLGDRSCLALALRRNCPVVTADRAWASLSLDVPVELIR